MAVDEAISIACREGAALPTLRFYTWSPPCISIGYFQKIDRVLTKIGVERNHTEIVRRITGGRAVFHGNDLSYSIVCNTDNRLFPGTIMGTYNLTANAFVSGLKYLGISADHIQTPANYPLPPTPKSRRYHKSTLCFATTLGHEISVKGRKLIGSAQRQWPDVFLQHGSVLITENQEGNGTTSISLSEILGGNIDIKTIIAALSAGFRDKLRIDLVKEHLTQYEICLAKKLAEEKYSKTSWNEKYILPQTSS